MQPLEYKNIGSEKHLTFGSIRRLVLNELSDLSQREAKKHINNCYRCKGIHESLISPASIRREHPRNLNVPTLIGGLVSVILLMAMVASFLYFGSSSRPIQETQGGSITQSETEGANQEIERSQEVDPVMEAIDTMSQVVEEPEVTDPLTDDNKQFDKYIEEEQPVQQVVRLRGIYGLITGDGKPLPGVTVMVPGSKRAKISDTGGKYYIQVPRNARSLVFIYQGKQL